MSNRFILLTISAIALAGGLFNTFGETISPHESIPSHIHTLYSKWRVKYGSLRSTPSETSFRLQVFYQTYVEIQELRVVYPETQLALNAFADLTLKEFAANMLGSPKQEDVSEDSLRMVIPRGYTIPVVNPPSSYMVPNQRKVGNQGMCGSCWAWALKHITQDALGGNVEVSAQNIMNCNKLGRNCEGSWFEKAILDIVSQGYRTEDEEPYRATPGSCKGQGRTISKTPITLYKLDDENAIKQIIFGHSTGVAMRVKAENQVFKSYRGGLFSTTNPVCRGPDTDHAVTIVGWENQRNAWRLRNSWGDAWGEQGFMWIQINQKMASPGGCFCGSNPSDFFCLMTYWA